MKGYRFFRDCGSPDGETEIDIGKQRFIYQCRKRGIKPTQDTSVGNVIALFLDDWNNVIAHWDGHTYAVDCYAGIFFRNNSDVTTDSVSHAYLRDNCIRVSADVARKIHPRMFAVIDADDNN
jgi:hypothetical protein